MSEWNTGEEHPVDMLMTTPFDEKRGPGSRLKVAIPVRARWFDSLGSGKMIETAGFTVNISPSGLLINVDRLPEIGTMLSIDVDRQENSDAGRKRGGARSQASSLQGIVLWVDEDGESPPAAAIELDFTGGDDAAEQMRYWMDDVYEPQAIKTALELAAAEQIAAAVH